MRSSAFGILCGLILAGCQSSRASAGGVWERVDDVCNCRETWAFLFPVK